MEHNDLISRNDAMNAIFCLMPTFMSTDGKPVYVEEIIAAQKICDDALRALREVPALDADPIVYAKWAHIGGDEWCCSNCGEVTTTEGSWEKPVYKRCYECGARMDRKEPPNV